MWVSCLALLLASISVGALPYLVSNLCLCVSCPALFPTSMCVSCPCLVSNLYVCVMPLPCFQPLCVCVLPCLISSFYLCVCVLSSLVFDLYVCIMLALFLAYVCVCPTLFLTFLKLVVWWHVSKIIASGSYCCNDPNLQTLVVNLKNLKIGWCIHGNKPRLFTFFCKRLLLSWLLPSYLSFLLILLLLLHSCKKFMLFNNSWLLHSCCNPSPTQHPNFCLYFNLLLLCCYIAKFLFIEKGHMGWHINYNLPI
jgi:hypothetical protein